MENKFLCTYPGCKKEGEYKQSFELINEEGSQVELIFCQYHHLIVVGGHFKAKINKIPAIKPTKKEPKGTPEIIEFELIGPLQEVEIAEQVLGAKEMVYKLKSEDKKKNKI